ncbi:hypothetical protein JX265_010498 [Neoarthrinium moseri]|uniref:Xylanolytic transcriptional activator regulatory domain-containing protein n=1 Tax=Neoarthrinium moseri TaxID=1658444 RepID=A0A9P9WDW5_9PEZI|nr:hypothetical protein JX265_010498 [Neoarthrinium moseri]
MNPCERCLARGEHCDWVTETQGVNHHAPTKNDVMEQLLPESLPNSQTPESNCAPSDRSTIKRYIDAYFDKVNAMSCVFLHKPTILADWSQDQLDPVLTILICALGLLLNSRSHEQRDTARVWVDEAQLRILGTIAKQTVGYLQALLLLVQFHFLAGHVREAWNLISLAARLAFTLRLNYEHPEIHPIEQECRRRMVWSIYLLDRMFSGGVDDLGVCPASRMYVRLPCNDHSFHRGLPSSAAYLDPCEGNETFQADLLAQHIRLYAIRERILRYTKGVRRDGSSPVLTKMTLQSLERELQSFVERLPENLQLEPDNFLLVMHSEDAPGFDLGEPIDDVFLPVSIYQVTQIIHHLKRLLPHEGEHSVSNIRTTLSKSLEMACKLQQRYPRIERCLEDTRQLLQVLGQDRRDLPKLLDPGQRLNPQHLPSLHSLIPDPLEQSIENSDTRGKARLSKHHRISAGQSYLMSSSSAQSVDLGRPQVTKDPFEPLVFEGHAEFEPANMFDMQFNGYYDPEQNDFMVPFTGGGWNYT